MPGVQRSACIFRIFAPRTSHLAPRTSHLAPRTPHLAPRASSSNRGCRRPHSIPHQARACAHHRKVISDCLNSQLYLQCVAATPWNLCSGTGSGVADAIAIAATPQPRERGVYRLRRQSI
ncbi:hypothetical protein C2E23DRAFT_458255 [Lenzites betulinus]|nr:hypothetical protein C2E23DRAFT_458255 [Lenzites betulinus]